MYELKIKTNYHPKFTFLSSFYNFKIEVFRYLSSGGRPS